jgi:hypothetical protein
VFLKIAQQQTPNSIVLKRITNTYALIFVKDKGRGTLYHLDKNFDMALHFTSYKEGSENPESTPINEFLKLNSKLK